MGSAELALPSSSSTSAMSGGAVDQVRKVMWSKGLQQPEGAEAIVEELQEDAFSSTNLIVDDDFKLKMDASLIIMIMQNVLLQMGLSLVGTEGKRIQKVKTWVLRCHACFKYVVVCI